MIYKRKEKDGFTLLWIAIDLKANEKMIGWQFTIGIQTRIESVEAYICEIEKKVKTKGSTHKEDPTVTTSVQKIRGDDLQHFFYAIFNFDDCLRKCDEVLKVVKNELLPFIEKMQNIEEIDKLINRGKKIWGTDWNQKIGLGGNFGPKRLVIAYLAGGIEHMEEVNMKENVAIAKLVEEQGTGPFDPSYKQKLDNPVGYTLHYLRSLPAPLAI